MDGRTAVVAVHATRGASVTPVVCLSQCVCVAVCLSVSELLAREEEQ